MSRVSAQHLRTAVLASDVPLREVARAAGVMRSDRASVDTTRLRRSLGIDPTSKGHFNVTVDEDLAHRVCAAIGREFDDVFGRAAPVCSECGEELVGSPDGLCGFCREERALAGVAA